MLKQALLLLYPDLNYSQEEFVLFMMSSFNPTLNRPSFTPSSLPIYSFDWSPHSAYFCSLAVGSFVTQRSLNAASTNRNEVQIVSLTDPQVNEFQAHSAPIVLDYPITKVQYSPHRMFGGDSELLGVSGDGLRIYKCKMAGSATTAEHELIAKLVPAQISTSPTASATASRRPSDANIITNNPGQSATSTRNSPAPITSFDWNRVDPNLLITSSYDTTCAVWNLDTASVKTQLIAHDKEVFDVAFNPKSPDIFASVGAEGSIRLFDTRSLDHSTILYETADAQPLLRLAWNPLDNNYVSCFAVDSGQVIIVDVRSAAVPVAILTDHINGISSMRWAPHNSGWLAVSDGAGLKLWDVSQNVSQPTWALPSSSLSQGTLQNLVWPSTAPDWIAASTATEVHLIKL